MPSRLLSVEVRGFRAFGTEPTPFDFSVPITVVHAGNSQGKTSLAEALEFLISGRSSRRDLLGGAKAEYHDSLRNAHMPAEDERVYVEAVVRTEDGKKHDVRRELVQRYLENPRHTLVRISQMLGYSSPSAFTRWFGAQFGMAPQRWRAGRKAARGAD